MQFLYILKYAIFSARTFFSLIFFHQIHFKSNLFFKERWQQFFHIFRDSNKLFLNCELYTRIIKKLIAFNFELWKLCWVLFYGLQTPVNPLHSHVFKFSAQNSLFRGTKSQQIWNLSMRSSWMLSSSFEACKSFECFLCVSNSNVQARHVYASLIFFLLLW